MFENCLSDIMSSESRITGMLRARLMLFKLDFVLGR